MKRLRGFHSESSIRGEDASSDYQIHNGNVATLREPLRRVGIIIGGEVKEAGGVQCGPESASFGWMEEELVVRAVLKGMGRALGVPSAPDSAPLLPYVQ